MAAQVQMGGIPVGWDAWKPGFADPSQVTGKLAGLLDDAGITVKGITGTTMDRLATAIEQGVAAGDSVDGITTSLGDVVTARAEMIAQTESARLLTNAAMNQYRDMGIRYWDLVTSAGACAQCLSIASANPHPVGDGNEPPVHPYCRCAASPHIEGTTP
jgi:hypothetical protein